MGREDKSMTAIKLFLENYLYWIIGIAFAALLAVAGIQTVRLSKADTELAQEKQSRAEVEADRFDMALTHANLLAAKESTHAAETIAKDAEYESELKKRESRNAVLVSDNSRMRKDIKAYAAIDKQIGESDSDYTKRCEYRLEAVAGLLGEGLSLSLEGRQIIERRDAEVVRLRDQIDADRKACSQ
jgi:hypothetical protein